MSSAAPAFKAAVFAACKSIYAAPIQVCYGHPGMDLEPDIVSVGDVRVTATQPVMSAARPREEVLELDVTFSCYRGGGPEAQQPVTERAYALLALLEEYARNDAQITFASSVRRALVVSHEMTEANTPELLAAGRSTQIVATIRAEARN